MSTTLPERIAESGQSEQARPVDAPAKPPQASRGDPHWVVVTLSVGPQGVPIEARQRWRRLYRHSTQDAANAECRRLAAANPGTWFAVYGSGISVKVGTDV